MTDEEIKKAFASVVQLLPHGKAKEEIDLAKAAISLGEIVLLNLNSIARSLETIADYCDSLHARI